MNEQRAIVEPKIATEMVAGMKFCGREFTAAELGLIVEMVTDFGSLNLTELSRTLCELLEWKRPSGGLKSLECRQMLTQLSERGWFRLPELQGIGPRGPRVIKLSTNSEPQAEIGGPASEFQPLHLKVVKAGRGGDSGLWRELIERYNYLGYRAPVGANLRYLIYSEKPANQPLGCMLWTSPAWKIEVRDRWIGWDAAVRARNLQWIVSNSRFLVLPWVRVKHMASMILGQCARQLPGDWQGMYGYRPLLMETMVDSRRFRGTCYRAANWVDLGMTKGRGRMDRDHERQKEEAVAVKQVLVYPLCRKARERLLTGAAPSCPQAQEDE